VLWPGSSDKALNMISFSGFIKPVRIGGLIPKRWPVVGGVLLVAALGGLWVWAPWMPREPLYDGKPLSYWLAQTQPLSEARWHVLARQDTNAIPFLVSALKRGNFYNGAYFRLPPWLQKRLPVATEHYRALVVLEMMGPLAKPAVPTLIRTLKAEHDAMASMYAARVLSIVGEGDSSAAAALNEALLDTDPAVRLRLIRKLNQMKVGVAGDEAVRHVAVSSPAKTTDPVSVDKFFDVLPFPGSSPVRIGAGDSNVGKALVEDPRDDGWQVRNNPSNALKQVDRVAAPRAGVTRPPP
jgi:hypothetical protein